MEKFFELKGRGTNVRTEIVAGVTSFMTIAYILAVNPLILGASGMDMGAVFTATALASAFATFCMALLANMPFVLSWQQALAAIFVEGVIFIFLSLVNIREAIFNAIPPSLKIAVSVGIGLFISFIGLQNAHIVVAGPTLVTLYSFKHSVEGGMFHSEGITVLLALIGLLITAFLLIREVKGAVLFGIIATWGLGMICQAIGLYVPNPEAGFFSLFPSGIISMPASLSPTLMQVDFSSVLSFEFFTVLMAFLFVDLFDTIGTVIGCASKANLLDKDGKLPKVKQVLLTDAIGTTAGSLIGTSTITTFVESSAGIAEGGKTGLTAVTAGALFFLALFFSPVFLAIPAFATAPALIIVGFLMMQQVAKISWTDDVLTAVPAYITIFSMAFMYSISEGICFGVISYTLLHVGMGKGKDVTPLMYILTVLFILKYAFL